MAQHNEQIQIDGKTYYQVLAQKDTSGSHVDLLLNEDLQPMEIQDTHNLIHRPFSSLSIGNTSLWTVDTEKYSGGEPFYFDTNTMELARVAQTNDIIRDIEPANGYWIVRVE